MLKENGISKKLLIVLSIGLASLFVACSSSTSSMDDGMMEKDKMHDTMMEKKHDGMMEKDKMHDTMMEKKHDGMMKKDKMHDTMMEKKDSMKDSM